jgi:hypothetical protein
MSLMVCTYQRDVQTGKITENFIDAEAYVAGLEIYRTEVWDSEAVRKRGAKFLPLLSVNDLYIDSEQLDDFEAECKILLEDIDAITVENSGLFNNGVSQYEHYLQNFLKAISSARSLGVGGGVYIG